MAVAPLGVASSAPAPAGEAQLPAAEAAPRPAAAEPHVYAEHLQSMFQSEPDDAGWSRSARQGAQERLAAAAPDPSVVRSLECRSSMCRLETSILGADDDVKLVRAALGERDNPTWSGAVFSRIEEDASGRPVRVSYLFRAGTTLPIL
jgi:hypothetical protein